MASSHVKKCLCNAPSSDATCFLRSVWFCPPARPVVALGYGRREGGAPGDSCERLLAKFIRAERDLKLYEELQRWHGWEYARKETGDYLNRDLNETLATVRGSAGEVWLYPWLYRR